MIRTLVATLALAAAATTAHAVTLYDAALGTSPVAQGLTYSDAALVPGPFYTVDATGTTLNTVATTPVYAGFGSNATTLDRSVGFTLRIDARVNNGSGTNADRAGFSFFALASDHRGVEIALQPATVFAQSDSPLFTRAESVAFDTTAAVTRYELTVLNDAYTLTANGTSILTGALRDYTAFVPPFGQPDPYEVPNAIFLGDNTSSAQGSTLITYVSVPEPTTLATIAGLAIVARRRRR